MIRFSYPDYTPRVDAVSLFLLFIHSYIHSFLLLRIEFFSHLLNLHRSLLPIHLLVSFVFNTVILRTFRSSIVEKDEVILVINVQFVLSFQLVSP